MHFSRLFPLTETVMSFTSPTQSLSPRIPSTTRTRLDAVAAICNAARARAQSAAAGGRQVDQQAPSPFTIMPQFTSEEHNMTQGWQDPKAYEQPQELLTLSPNMQQEQGVTEGS